MAILRVREVWERERPAAPPRNGIRGLTVAEQHNVQDAIRFLAKRHGSLVKLAVVMNAMYATVYWAMRNTVSPEIALKTSRVAGAPLEEVLTGRWPPSNMCPCCGRSCDHA